MNKLIIIKLKIPLYFMLSCSTSWLLEKVPFQQPAVGKGQVAIGKGQVAVGKEQVAVGKGHILQQLIWS